MKGIQSGSAITRISLGLALVLVCVAVAHAQEEEQPTGFSSVFRFPGAAQCWTTCAWAHHCTDDRCWQQCGCELVCLDECKTTLDCAPGDRDCWRACTCLTPQQAWSDVVPPVEPGVPSPSESDVDGDEQAPEDVQPSTDDDSNIPSSDDDSEVSGDSEPTSVDEAEAFDCALDDWSCWLRNLDNVEAIAAREFNRVSADLLVIAQELRCWQACWNEGFGEEECADLCRSATHDNDNNSDETESSSNNDAATNEAAADCDPAMTDDSSVTDMDTPAETDDLPVAVEDQADSDSVTTVVPEPTDANMPGPSTDVIMETDPEIIPDVMEPALIEPATEREPETVPEVTEIVAPPSTLDTVANAAADVVTRIQDEIHQAADAVADWMNKHEAPATSDDAAQVEVTMVPPPQKEEPDMHTLDVIEQSGELIARRRLLSTEAEVPPISVIDNAMTQEQIERDPSPPYAPAESVEQVAEYYATAERRAPTLVEMILNVNFMVLTNVSPDAIQDSDDVIIVGVLVAIVCAALVSVLVGGTAYAVHEANKHLNDVSGGVTLLSVPRFDQQQMQMQQSRYAPAINV